MINIEDIKEQLDNNLITSEELVEKCFAKIDEPNGQGQTTFTRLYKQQSLEAAQQYDNLRKSNAKVPEYAGIPITIKDLFDYEGDVTTAGSIVLKNNTPASQHATVVARLLNAGFIILGKTNMTEFAYSGLGLNPHYGTPLNPYDRETGRIPGGSSSGAAISVTDGFATAGVGTDTGGSCRIPAALCGIVGYKPTQNRVPLDGTVPLSPSLDSIGPLAATVKSCSIIDAIISGENNDEIAEIKLKDLNLAIPKNPMLLDLDKHVSTTFESMLTLLSKLGAKIVEIDLPELTDIPQQSKNGGLAAAEAYHWHKDLLATSFDQYDPRVSRRIINWEAAKKTEYEELLKARKEIIKSVHNRTHQFDALICPTVPTIAPTMNSMKSDEEYLIQNALMLRNPSLYNFLDRCAISVPCHEKGSAPVGLMLSGQHGSDRRLLSIAAAVEKKL